MKLLAQTPAAAAHSRRVRSAVKWTTASNIFNAGMQTAVGLVLAALLGPKVYGIVAMAGILISFLELLPGFGFATAIIQAKELNNNELTSVFWVNMLGASGVATVAVLGSRWWAAMNHNDELRSVTAVLALTLPVNCLAIVQTALLQRDLRFKSLALRDGAGSVAGGAVGIAMAVAGFGVWSLVAQQIVRSCVACILVWWASPWRPSGRPRLRSLRPMMGFASKTYVGKLGVFFQNNTDNLLIGLAFGPVAVGLYRFAARLVEMILTFLPRAVQVVALPQFSRLQADQRELCAAFIKGAHLSCLASLPFLALLAGAPQQVLAAIGPNWLPAAGALVFLSFVGLSKAVLLLVGPLLQSVARPGWHAFNTWASAAANAAGVFLIARALVGATPGEQAAGIALVRAAIFCVAFGPLLLWQARRASGLSFVALFKALRGSCAAGLFTALCLAALTHIRAVPQFGNAMASLLLSTLVAAGLWYGFFRFLDKPGFLLVQKEMARVRSRLKW